ncbi:MAG: hypothetical protein LBH13_01950, partial [Cellulomonadaceae bacterium]|nr:hypothetical protein [Cellulomonadaceae bacterium]
MSFRKRLIAGVVAASIGFSGLATVIILGPKSPEEDQALAATDSPARATLTMGVSSNADALTPGADLTFGLTLGCDAPEEPGCIGAVLTDDIPAFLQVTDIDVLTE